MTFLNPFGLIGLLSLPVIVYLHMLNRRKRRLVVSHLDLWSFLDTQKIGPERRKIPITWILLLDLLIAALVSLALARPQITFLPPMQSARQHVILVDISSSMLAWEGAGSRIDQAKAGAKRLITLAGPEDVVTLITFGRQAHVDADSRQAGQSSAASLEAAVDGLQVGETTGEGASSALRQALALGEAALDPKLAAEFTVFTDGNFPGDALGLAASAGGTSAQEATAGAAGVFPHPLRWELVGTGQDNQAVIALNATRLSDSQMQVFTRIANFSEGFASREAVLEVDGREAGRALIDLPAGSGAPHVWQIVVNPAKPPAEVTVRLEGSDALPVDDTAAIGLQAGGTIRVALVAEKSAGAKAAAVIQQAFRAIPGVDLSVLTPAEYSQKVTERFDLTVFDGFLPQAWPVGQVLLADPPGVVPSTGSDNPSQADGSAAFTSGLARAIPPGAALEMPNPSPLVEGIDFGSVRWGRVWTMANPPRGFAPLLEADGTPLLLQGDIQLGVDGQPAARSEVTILLADLGQGNFTKQAAFPVLMANLVELARQAPLPAGFLTGEALPLPEPGSFRSIQVTSPDGQTLNLGAGESEEWTQTMAPGLYRFKLVRANGETVRVSAGARAGSQEESDLRPRSWARAASEASRDGRKADGQMTEREVEQKIDLRPWLLGATILALLMEAVLAWRR